MPTLHVRNIPDRLHERINKLASEHGSSLSAQVVILLEKAVEMESRKAAQSGLLREIKRRRSFHRTDKPAKISLSLLREDRKR